tara:strand:+ start:8312 stop:8980 length:669 start_codon:yes stop_codon:yes gene_type:complete
LFAKKGDDLRCLFWYEGHLLCGLCCEVVDLLGDKMSAYLIELRDLLAIPSEASWLGLATFFSRQMDEVEKEVCIQYARQHMAGWPASLRCGPELKKGQQLQIPWSLVAHLDLSERYLRDHGLEAFLNGRDMSQIVSIDLRHNMLRSPSVWNLLQAKGLVQLRRLDLSHNQIDRKGAELLMESELLQGLEWINLLHNDLRLEDLYDLADENEEMEVVEEERYL